MQPGSLRRHRSTSTLSTKYKLQNSGNIGLFEPSQQIGHGSSARHMPPRLKLSVTTISIFPVLWIHDLRLLLICSTFIVIAGLFVAST